MNLNLPVSRIIEVISPIQIVGESHGLVRFISVDTRKLHDTNMGCFVALQGSFRHGIQFLNEAYDKGARCFISDVPPDEFYEDACYLMVEDALCSLQEIARQHRLSFNYPVVAITGSQGKTTVKEWLYELLQTENNVVRSPKSYNSQLGVALSLLEMHAGADVALIEAGISEPNEMDELIRMISPTHAILTNIGSAHLENFESENQLKTEKIKILKAAQFAYSAVDLFDVDFEYETLMPQKAHPEIASLKFKDPSSFHCAAIAINFIKSVQWVTQPLSEAVSKLNRLALRMETFNGKNNSIVINDAYNLDMDALRFSLEYMQTFGRTRSHCVYIGLDSESFADKGKIETLVMEYAPDHMFVDLVPNLPVSIPENAVVLIKGTRKSEMEKFAARLREKQHQTKLEINFTALRHNLVYFKSLLAPGVKMLAMVKSQSYGTGLEKMAAFLEGQGIDYLGVAYTNEGVELRKYGIKTPILVMNADQDSYADCIAYQLEPSIYSFKQLDLFIRVVIESDVEQAPIHIKLDTGMRRLGFEPSQLKTILEICQAQPEVYIKGVYSHLAASGGTEHKDFTESQVERFTACVAMIEKELPHPILKHLVNTDGVIQYPNAHFNMVRIGIGMFGLADKQTEGSLKSVVTWKSVVSQIKEIQVGESVGYNRSFIASRNQTIAIVPVGYGDGFPRSLSNGKGCVYIQNHPCPTVGMVCMDMLMIDVTGLEVEEGDPVILFENNTQLSAFAAQATTIPYEILTSISQRIHRTYISE